MAKNSFFFSNIYLFFVHIQMKRYVYANLVLHTNMNMQFYFCMNLLPKNKNFDFL
jgi:hypothetical protein